MIQAGQNGAPPPGGVPVSGGRTLADLRRALHRLRDTGQAITPEAVARADCSPVRVARAPSGLRLAVALSDLAIKSEHEKSCKHDRSCKPETAWKREHYGARDTGTATRTVDWDGFGVMRVRKDGVAYITGRAMRNAKGTRPVNRPPPSRGIWDCGRARMACIVNGCKPKEERDPALNNLHRVLPKTTATL